MSKPVSDEAREGILDSLRSGCDLKTATRPWRLTPDDARAGIDGADLATAFAAGAPVEAVSFADIARMSAEREAAERAEVTPVRPRVHIFDESDGDEVPRQSPREAERWARIREEAAALGPEKIGYLHWLDRARVDARPKLHPMDAVWRDHFIRFYESGKRVDVARKGLRAGGSEAACHAITAELMLIEKTLEPGVECVGLVVSANTADGEDRFDSIKQNMRAFGYRETKERAKEDDNEEGRYRTAGGGNSGRVISFRDSQGHRVEFRISAANEAGVASCTAGTALGDELDLWGRKEGKNPANRIVDVLITRISTQPNAVVHLMSATYDRDSHHAQMIAAGDTVRQCVSRLGALGAMRDTEARLRLASAICSSDPLLLTPGDPMSTDLPTWVTNPTCPIETCYELADGNLARMVSLYGARPDIVGATKGDDSAPWTMADVHAFAAFNESLNQEGPRPGSMRRDGLLPIPGYGEDNKPLGSGGGWRGL